MITDYRGNWNNTARVDIKAADFAITTEGKNFVHGPDNGGIFAGYDYWRGLGGRECLGFSPRTGLVRRLQVSIQLDRGDRG